MLVDARRLDHGHVHRAPAAAAHLGGEGGQVVVLEADLARVDAGAHGAVAHVGPPPADQPGPGENAVHQLAGGGAGEQVDLELLARLGPAHQFARDELGIAGGEAGDEQVGAVTDVLGRGAGIGDLVGERGVTDAWVHEGRFRSAWERPAAVGLLAGWVGMTQLRGQRI